jgi:membrane-associated phospholipid phosphatase
MKSSILLLKEKRVFFAGLLIVLLSCSLMLLLNGKDPFISLNDQHPAWLNIFFVNYTFIGDGIFAACFVAFVLFYLKKRRTGLSLLYAFLIQGFFVQLIKNIPSASDPRLFFETGQYLYYTGKASLDYASFISGHTASVFALATTLILLMKKNYWQLPVLLIALLAAYSRMYLAGHQLSAVLTGAALGSFAGILAIIFVVDIRKTKVRVHRMPMSQENSVMPSFN